MTIRLEHWTTTDDYRVSLATPDTTRVVAVAWSHRCGDCRRQHCAHKTWAVYHVIDGGGCINWGLGRRATQALLRTLAREYAARKEVSKQ